MSAAAAAAMAAGYNILREGEAEILLRGNDVFYNKAQIVNRDLSIGVLRAFVEARKDEEESSAAAAAAKRRLKSDGAPSGAAATATVAAGGGGTAEGGADGGAVASAAPPTAQPTASAVAAASGSSTAPAAVESSAAGNPVDLPETGGREGQEGGESVGEERAAAAVGAVPKTAEGGSGGSREESEAAGLLVGDSVSTKAEQQQQQQQQQEQPGEAKQQQEVEASPCERKLQKPLRILEGLAASGLRAIRYALEVDGVGEVVALDKDPGAVEACERNVMHNRQRLAAAASAAVAVDSTAAAATAAASAEEAAQERKPLNVRWEQGDARLYMLTHEHQFDAVDLDPYGSPSIFLDSAVQCVSEGGLLLCTATDMAVLCGNNAEVCYSKYGGYPHRSKYCHEMALRILLACVESHANRYKRHIVPVLSVSVDFYIRVFVRVYTSAKAVKATPSKLAWVYQCTGCESFHLQRVGRVVDPRQRHPHHHAADCDGKANGNDPPPSQQQKQPQQQQPRYLPGLGPVVGRECKECGRTFAVGGPIWAEELHDKAWVRRMLWEMEAHRSLYPAYAKVHGLLTAVSEELDDVPLFVDLHGMSATLKCTPPAAAAFRSAIINAGHCVSSTHASPLGLKTDAPMNVLWDIMRCWVKKHPVKAHPEGSAASALLAKEPSTEADFSKARGALSKAQLNRTPRFVPNPESYWGPKPRARRVAGGGGGGAPAGVAAAGSGGTVAAGGGGADAPADVGVGGGNTTMGEEAPGGGPGGDASVAEAMDVDGDGQGRGVEVEKGVEHGRERPGRLGEDKEKAAAIAKDEEAIDDAAVATAAQPEAKRVKHGGGD